MKVIVAIDQTENWKQVIDAVTKRRWPADTSFRILTVVAPEEWQDLEFADTNDILREIVKLRCLTAERILQAARQKLSEAFSDCTVHVELRKGSPRIEVLDAAVDWMPDKIVLGAHGHDCNRLLPATVSRAVAQYAKCSVELVRLKSVVKVDENDKQREASRV